jgi:hypothetical protein
MGQRQSRGEGGDEILLPDSLVAPAETRNSSGKLADFAALVTSRGFEHELIRTPSAQRDIASASSDLRKSVVHRQAARAQHLRAQLRAIDASVVEAQWELGRVALLRGPSGRRLVCDADCIVGGCEEEFAEEDGVLCSGCNMFLCNPCFGSSIVKNECQVGGRFDSNLSFDSAVSPPGILPCPLFPQNCPIGHIPLHKIQRSMLHRKNRGRDGDDEGKPMPTLVLITRHK